MKVDGADMGAMSDAALTASYKAIEHDAEAAIAWALLGVLTEIRAAREEREERERSLAAAYFPEEVPS